MMLLFQRYLELFPDVWRDRIMAHCDLAARLGVVFYMSMDVGDVSIPADKVETAIAEALTKLGKDGGGQSMSPIKLDGGPSATLRSSGETTRAGTLSATIKAGSETAHLDPVLVAHRAAGRGLTTAWP